MVFCPSLLITDDDRDFRETLREVFEPQGFRTVTACNGEEAIRVVEKQEIHLVLIDMHMPRLTGIEAIARIKRLKARLPCILISGKLDDEMRRSAGAFRVLDKPVSFREITSTVSDAMQVTYNWPDGELLT